MAHGITLTMREIKRPAPEFIVEHEPDEIEKRNGRLYSRRVKRTPYINPLRDLKRRARLRKDISA